jgi:YesN/AraC family two-component response regulator
MFHLMLVDDEPNILSSLRRAINAMPWSATDTRVSIETFDSPAAALARAGEQTFDLVISDYRMPDMNGVDFLERMAKIQPEVARIILSGYADLQAVINAINRAQISRFVSKPWDELELSLAITQALEQRRLRMENARLADLVRLQQGQISRHEAALRRLEQEHPGLTRIQRHEDGSVDLELDDSELSELERRLGD